VRVGSGAGGFFVGCGGEGVYEVWYEGIRLLGL
jgi:hypothetical protein